MLNKIHNAKYSCKPSKLLLIKLLPIVTFLALLIIGISLGIGDPNGPPPGPK